VLVVSNRADAAGLAHAAAQGIPTAIVESRGRSREAFEAELQAVLAAQRVELVALAGFMRVLTAPFVTRWQGRMVNIHPALLPAFKGLDTHARALAAGDRGARLRARAHDRARRARRCAGAAGASAGRLVTSRADLGGGGARCHIQGRGSPRLTPLKTCMQNALVDGSIPHRRHEMTEPTSPKRPVSRRVVMQRSAALVGAGLFIQPARASVELRLTHPADLSHPVHIEADKMVKRIAERTNGAVKITLFPNNALGSPVETAQQTRLGAIDMILMNPANIESISKAVGVINIPYQFDSYEHAHRTLDVTGQAWIARQLSAVGFSWVANFEWGFRALSNSRRAINTPDDVRGLKLRVPPELAIKAAFEALGANTQTIAFQEVYLALANKTVDGQDNPIGTTFAAKFFEVQSHIALTRHIYTSIMLAANQRTWQGKLNDAQRKIISEEAVVAGQAARKTVREREEDNLKTMQGAGVAITRPSVAPFRDKMGPAYEVLRKSLGEETWTAWTGMVNAARG